MTFQEMESTLQRVTDNLVVQGEMLDRLDRRVEDLAGAIHDLYTVTDRLAKVSETHNQRLLQMVEIMEAHEQRLVRVEDQQAVMLGALTSLLQRMDAFIQGIQKGDGNPPGKT
ncbi:MAG: hypothetical protein LAP13_02530 [Acidobacteriia bacterium]|nr:hypothetical protein [Terriglobia bacterium]